MCRNEEGAFAEYACHQPFEAGLLINRLEEVTWPLADSTKKVNA